LPSLSEKLEKFLSLLVTFSPFFVTIVQFLLDEIIEVLYFPPFRWQRAEDSKPESQIVNVLQDIVEIIIQDVMVDGPVYVLNIELDRFWCINFILFKKKKTIIYNAL
jgi:hypothetical protein